MGGKNFKNKISKNDEDDKFIGEDEYYTGKKNMNLHNIKCDIPPNEYLFYCAGAGRHHHHPDVVWWDGGYRVDGCGTGFPTHWRRHHLHPYLAVWH